MLWLWLPVLAANLAVPPEAEPGKPVEIVGEGLPPGTYFLEVQPPEGEEEVYNVEAREGRFRFLFTPKEGGEYRLRMWVDGEPLEAVLRVLLPNPRLTDVGLWLGPGLEIKLPDPASWMGPVEQGFKVYVARPLLVLEVNRFTGKMVRHYPPHRVTKLLPGPELVLEDGRRLGLEEIRTLPFEAPWTELASLAKLERSLGDYDGDRPYWSLWAERRSDPEALSMMGQDLLARGHRPELAWGEDYPFRYLVDAAKKARGESLEESLALTRFLFDFTPLFPGSEAFFSEAARWLWAQDRLLEAERLRIGADWVRHYRRLRWGEGVWWLLVFVLVAYLALLFKALVSGGRPLGARLVFSERLLLPVLLLLLAALAVAYGLGQRVEATLAEGFSRATLETLKAKETIAALPESPERSALLEGKGLKVPSAVLRLRANRPRSALAWDSQNGLVREALALGGDPWTEVYRRVGVPRPKAPTDRELEWLVSAAWVREFLARPIPVLRGMGLSPLLLGLAAFVFVLLFLVHIIALFRGAPSRPNLAVRLLELLVPGLVGFGAGVGLFLLAAALYGAWRLLLGDAQGALWLGGAYLVNLVWLAVGWRGAKA